MKITLFLLLFSFFSFSQVSNGWVDLDSTVIKVRSNFNTEDFISMIKEDTSFYKAFKNLFLFEHSSISNIYVFNKDEDEKASLTRQARHYHENDSSWIKIKSEKTEGKYYNRKNTPKYYTGTMFDKVFFPTDTFPYSSNTVKAPYEQGDHSSRTEKHYEQLKRFVFSPGSPIDDVPLIGDKLNIFDPSMRPFYNYSIKIENYADSIPCYVFTCKVKPDVREKDVVILYLRSYFDRKTLSVISRDYHLKHETALFDFDIFIKAKLERDFKDNYLPTELSYKGWWKVPFKKAEIMNFEMKNTY